MCFMKFEDILEKCNKGNGSYKLVEKVVDGRLARGYVHAQYGYSDTVILEHNKNMLTKWATEDQTKKEAQKAEDERKKEAKKAEDLERANKKKLQKRIEQEEKKRIAEEKKQASEAEKKAEKERSHAANERKKAEDQAKALKGKRKKADASKNDDAFLASQEKQAELERVVIEEGIARDLILQQKEISFVRLFRHRKTFEITHIIECYIALFEHNRKEFSESLQILETAKSDKTDFDPFVIALNKFIQFFLALSKFLEELLQRNHQNCYATVCLLHYYIGWLEDYTNSIMVHELIPTLMECKNFEEELKPSYTFLLNFLDELFNVCEKSTSPVFKHVLRKYPEFGQVIGVCFDLSMDVVLESLVDLGALAKDNGSLKIALNDAIGKTVLALFHLTFNPQTAKCDSVSEVAKMDPANYDVFVKAVESLMNVCPSLEVASRNGSFFRSKNWSGELKVILEKLQKFCNKKNSESPLLHAALAL